MFPMKHFNQEKDNLIITVFSELKILGVKVPKIKKFKASILKSEKSVQETGGKIFGVSLSEQEWISNGECLLPKFLAMSTAYLHKFITREVGLFRKAGNFARQKKLRMRVEVGDDLDDSEPNDVASLLKQWLRELPEPLIPPCLQDLLMRCLHLEAAENQVTACLLTCLMLRPDHLHTLKHLLCFMARIAANEVKNKMDVSNLALIMAPNIFAFNEPVDKIKSDMLLQHTLIVELLIKNCDKIGEIPADFTFRNSILCPELDSSSDILDSNSNKSKKKRRSGGAVQDIFSGFRKFVGQNNTPTSKNGTPENILKTPSLPRSAFKRKADPSLQSISPLKKNKQAHSLEGLDNPSLITTPTQKGMFLNSTEKMSSAHVRRKSIGVLLRRKDKTRSKSSKLPSENLELKCLPNDCTIIDGNKAEKLSNSKLSPNNSTYSNGKMNNVHKRGSIKKSVSDHCLQEINTEFSMLPSIVVSSSRGSLQNRPLRTSGYNLRSETVNNSQLSEVTLLETDVKEGNNSMGSKLNSFEEKSEKEISVEIMEKPKMAKSFSSKNNVLNNFPHVEHKNRKSFNCDRKSCDSPKELNYRKTSPQLSVMPEFSFSKISNSELSKNIKNNPINTNSFGSCKSKDVTVSEIDSQNSNETVAHTLARQEGFIVRTRKKKSKNSTQIKRHNSTNSSELNSKYSFVKENDTPSSKLQNTEIAFNDRNAPERKSLRRKTRHGSLIRGKPNSVYSGLPSALSRHCSHESAVTLNSRPTICESSVKFDENELIESPRLQSLDLSLSILLQNFCLSSPIDTTGLNLNIGIKSDGNLSTVNLNVSQNEDVTQHPVASETFKNSTPLLNNRKRLSDNSGSKIPKLKDFSEPKRSNSFTENEFVQEIPNPKRSNSYFSESQCEKLSTPLNTGVQRSLNLTNEGQRFDNSCFKTPNNKYDSSDSINWISGSAFLSTIASPHEEIINKRESIAMILKNNTGHVQAKVSLYDNNLQNVTSSGTKQNCSQEDRILKSSSQKCYSANSRTKTSNSRNYDSTNKSSSVKSRTKCQKSPRPPPPKFILTDVNTPSPKVNHPLKEVTNINVEAEESKFDAFQKPGTPLKCVGSPLEIKRKTPNHNMKPKKLKRNSFSANTTHRLPKKVSRSESSPACHRRNIILH